VGPDFIYTAGRQISCNIGLELFHIQEKAGVSKDEEAISFCVTTMPKDGLLAVTQTLSGVDINVDYSN